MSTTSITPPPHTFVEAPGAPIRPRRFAQPNPNRVVARRLAFENAVVENDNPNQQPQHLQNRPNPDILYNLDNPNQI